MSIPETKDAVLLEFGAWQSIIHSEDWVVFRRLLKEHSEWLCDKALEHIDKKEYDEAACKRYAMKDCQKILTLIENRIKELREKGEK